MKNQAAPFHLRFQQTVQSKLLSGLKIKEKLSAKYQRARRKVIALQHNYRRLFRFFFLRSNASKDYFFLFLVFVSPANHKSICNYLCGTNGNLWSAFFFFTNNFKFLILRAVEREVWSLE